MKKRGGYHRGYFLERVLDAQQEFLKYSNSGRTTKDIFETDIQPRFHISRSTFYDWMAINAKNELKKIQVEQARQPELPFND